MYRVWMEILYILRWNSLEIHFLDSIIRIPPISSPGYMIKL